MSLTKKILFRFATTVPAVLCWMGGARAQMTGEMKHIIHKLFLNRDSVTRGVTQVETGVETVTWSNDPQVNSWIQMHIEQMTNLVASGGKVREWDETFRRLIDHANMFQLDCDFSAEGAKCDHKVLTDSATSLSDEERCAVQIIQAHADVILAFLQNGNWEKHRNHEAPC